MTDPGDEDHTVVDTCPFCGRSIRHVQIWITPLFVRDDRPFNIETRALDPNFKIEVHEVVTCRRYACKAEARRMQDESRKSGCLKLRDVINASMRRRYDPQPGFKDKDYRR